MLRPPGRGSLTPEDVAIPSFRTHPLKGSLAGQWSIWVNGNWRVTFRFIDSDVELVDYQDDDRTGGDHGDEEPGASG